MLSGALQLQLSPQANQVGVLKRQSAEVELTIKTHREQGKKVQERGVQLA